ncbi:hypothetical protein AYO44_13360 [Planctomycetaceae bacterium SCGC AG-212-F19]|nr:hypothetical protein AYO44_13360 [Planctomycetaceae bacterium SCGC AG-212-F19]
MSEIKAWSDKELARIEAWLHPEPIAAIPAPANGRYTDEDLAAMFRVFSAYDVRFDFADWLREAAERSSRGRGSVYDSTRELLISLDATITRALNNGAIHPEILDASTFRQVIVTNFLAGVEVRPNLAVGLVRTLPPRIRQQLPQDEECLALPVSGLPDRQPSVVLGIAVGNGARRWLPVREVIRLTKHFRYKQILADERLSQREKEERQRQEREEAQREDSLVAQIARLQAQVQTLRAKQREQEEALAK